MSKFSHVFLDVEPWPCWFKVNYVPGDEPQLVFTFFEWSLRLYLASPTCVERVQAQTKRLHRIVPGVLFQSDVAGALGFGGVLRPVYRRNGMCQFAIAIPRVDRDWGEVECIAATLAAVSPLLSAPQKSWVPCRELDGRFRQMLSISVDVGVKGIELSVMLAEPLADYVQSPRGEHRARMTSAMQDSSRRIFLLSDLFPISCFGSYEFEHGGALLLQQPFGDVAQLLSCVCGIAAIAGVAENSLYPALV